jgi:hypothetical protein
VQTEGGPAIEYISSGSLPWNLVSWNCTGEGRHALTVSRQGMPTIQAIYQLSADGQSLTYSRDKTTIVHHRWIPLD